MTEKFDLDRQTNEANSIDSNGKKWEIKQKRGRALYFTRPNPDREDAVIPRKMRGLWTKVELLKKEIDKYISASWDQAEAATQKQVRKAHAAKAVNDKGNQKPKESVQA